MADTSWARAWRIASDMDPARAQRVGLTSAIGAILAQPVAALAELPPIRSAETAGFAVCGIGPWRLCQRASLEDGEASRVAEGGPLPAGCAAVLPDDLAVVEEHVTGTLLLVGRDGVPSPRPGMVAAGTGIREPGADASAGQILLKPGGVVTAGTVALAAAAGADELTVIPPASVAPLMLGKGMLQTGPPRRGKTRDVVAPLVPTWVMGAGGRCLPEQAGAEGPEALAAQIDATECDLIVVTATAGSGVAQDVTPAVRHLRGEILIDRLAPRPGGPALLAELPEGRRVLALPREPAAAVVALALILGPMMRAVSGRPIRRWPTVMLRDPIPTSAGERAVAVAIERGELADLAHASPWSGPEGLSALADADGIAFVDPGRGNRGDSLPFAALPGRS